MMSRYLRRKFNPEAEFVVARKFLCNGVDFRPGMSFDKESVSRRVLQQLFVMRRVVEASPGDSGVARGSLEGKALEAGASDTVVESAAMKAAAEKASVADDAPQVTHVGGGKYAVTKGDIRMTGPLTKSEAEARLAEFTDAPGE